MAWTNLGNPRPKPEPQRYVPRTWEAGREQVLHRLDALPAADIAQMLFARRSRREFGDAPDERSLGHFLYLTAFAHREQPSELGFPLTWACAPSAGAIHGIHVLLVPAVGSSVWLYEPARHALVEQPGQDSFAVRTRAEAGEIVEIARASLLVLAAEPGKYAAKYDDCESLVWRDAGVLLGYMSVVAEALGLDFCCLGMTGDGALRELDRQSKLLGVGVAALGSRSANR